MAGQRSLSKSTRLLRARRFSEVISLLEPQVFLYRDNFTFYYNLGTACLYVGDFGGAFSYLQRARQLNGQNESVLLGLAAIHLRRRQATEALQCWLEILDRDPKNPVAKRGLALVRTNTDPSVYVTMAESGKLRRYYPALGFALPRWIVPAVAVVALGFAIFLLWPTIQGLFAPDDGPARIGNEFTLIDRDNEELTNFAGDFRYLLTEDEIERTFERVGELFNDFRDNLAQREVNRILNSNASDLVKERARLIAGYFGEPTFVNFSDNFDFAEVAEEPWLHNSCYVRWSGQVSNISQNDGTTSFVLLVGYEDERVLEGTIPVAVPFPADIQLGPVELIGRIGFDDATLTLTATSIRRISPAGDS